MTVRRSIAVTPGPGLVPAGAVESSVELVDRPETDGAHIFSAPAAEAAITAFEEAIGGRGALVSDLLASPDLTPRMQSILQLILDPRFDRMPLGELCDRANLTPGEVFAAFRDATVARANVLALKETAKRLPTVVSALLDAATDRTEICPVCDGTKQTLPQPTKKDPLPHPVKCSCCIGRGTIFHAGDRDAQKLALELVGLLKKGGGVQVNQHNLTQSATVTVEAAGSGGGLAQLQQAVSGLLFGQPLTLAPTPPVIEVEGYAVLPPSGDTP